MRKYYKATGITLGEGAFGKVFLFESKQNPEEKYAVKVLLKSELAEQTIDICREEITILAQLDHPHIVNYVESYEDNRYIYIVMECVNDAMDLWTATQNQVEQMKDRPDELLFPESEVRRMLFMILSGLMMQG